MNKKQAFNSKKRAGKGKHRLLKITAYYSGYFCVANQHTDSGTGTRQIIGKGLEAARFTSRPVLVRIAGRDKP